LRRPALAKRSLLTLADFPDFAREAQLANMKCEARDSASGLDPASDSAFEVQLTGALAHRAH
jgi:hypothetical protein